MSDYLSFHIKPDYVKGFSQVKPNWGFPIGKGNSLGEITYLTKYSRRKDNGRKERWHETCERVINGMYSILRDHCAQNRTPWNELKAQRSAQDAYQRLFEFKWTPPGRGLWVMGTEFVNERHNSAALQNCFTGDTRFICDSGAPTLAEMAGPAATTVQVQEHSYEAVVSSFGVQPVQKVTFAPANRGAKGWRKSRSNLRHDVKVTPNHRWITVDGSETTALKVGDLVPAVANGTPAWDDDDYDDGFEHGFIFADGSAQYVYANGDTRYELRLCGEKAVWANFFRAGGATSYSAPSHKGDPTVVVRSAANLKEFPIDASVSYLIGFVRGWLAGDGTLLRNTDGVVSLSSQHPGAEAFLRTYAATAGFVLRGISTYTGDTNYGPRSNPLKKFNMRRSDQLENCGWVVEAIEPLGDEEVFCATVHELGMFTLAEGILTGNCAFISTEKLSSHSHNEATLPFIRLMEMSMLGVGVGFDTKGADKLTIHQPILPPDGPAVLPIEDSREGWYDSLADLLKSYFFPNQIAVTYDYDSIRPAGEPIKGFGGVAAGPGPLRRLHDDIRKLFNGRSRGSKLTSSDIVDVMNLIGKCVVAGNVRRSAEIALGDATDKVFLDLKNFELNPERMGNEGWGNVSNNSVFAEVGGNYDHLVPRMAVNGEPGLLYLDLCQEYGRLIDPPNNRDYRVAGTNPCGEQSLESYECCTLVETFPINHEDVDDYVRTLKYAYLYAKAVTLLPTHWPETNEIMQRNRRIGCSVSGEAQFAEHYGWTEIRTWLNAGYQAVQERDKMYSEWLGVRESIKTTSVKPSGTVSLLAGVTPGVHWPTADVYIRRMRLAVNDPLLDALRDANYRVEPDFMDAEHTMVVELPTRGPNVRTEKEVSVWEKAALAVLHQRYWADNQVSVTLTFKPEETDQIGALLRAFEGQLKSLSMLPIFDDKSAYRQSPYERITDDEYDMMTSKVRSIDFKSLYAGKALDAEGERFCNNDTCTL